MLNELDYYRRSVHHMCLTKQKTSPIEKGISDAFASVLLLGPFWSAFHKVTNPASGVVEVKVVRSGTAVRPEEACAADMRMSGRTWE